MLKISYRKLSTLTPLESNPRTITEKDLEALGTAITSNPEHFEARPLILSDRTGEFAIIAGNMRYRAALQLGLKEVPTVLLTGLTEAKEREIAIRDNVNNGQWDTEKLELEWTDLPIQEWGVDALVRDQLTGAEEPNLNVGRAARSSCSPVKRALPRPS